VLERDVETSRRRKPFRDQTVAGIIWQMLQCMSAPTKSADRMSQGSVDDASSSDTAPDWSRLSRAAKLWTGVAAIALVVLSGAVLAGLYQSSLPSGLAAVPAPEPTVVPTETPLVVPQGIALVALHTYGGGGRSSVKLLQPQDALRGPDRRIYIADTGNHRVAILDRHGRLVETISKGANGPLQTPYSLAVAPDGNLLVLDSDAGRVLEYAVSGKLLRSSSPSLTLGHSRGIAVDARGQVLVADPAADAVFTLGADLSVVSIRPSTGPGQSQLFSQPSAITVGPDGGRYIVDSQNDRVVEYSADWRLLRSWPVPVPDTQHSPRVIPLADGGVLLSDPRDAELLLFGASTSSLRVYALPTGSSVPLGIALDGRARGDVLVTCEGSNTITEVHVPGLK
jgi:hypothetical protein